MRVKCLISTVGDFTAGKHYDVDNKGIRGNHGAYYNMFLRLDEKITPAEQWVNYINLPKRKAFILAPSSVRRF
jgi:hypothetical protein